MTTPTIRLTVKPAPVIRGTIRGIGLPGPASTIAPIADQTIVGNNTGSPAVQRALTASQVKTLLAILINEIGGLGTGVAAALGIAIGTNGGPVVRGGNIGAATGTSLVLSGAGSFAGGVISDNAAVSASNAASGELRFFSGAGTNWWGRINQFVFDVNSAMSLNWHSTGSLGTVDTSVSRNAAGVVQIGNAANNALGSIACAQVNASGTVTASAGVNSTMISASTGFRTSGGSGLLLAVDGSYNTGARLQSFLDGKMRVTNFAATGGCHFALNTADTLTIRNIADSADGSLACANATASGTVTGAAFSATPVTFAGLPPASANTGKSKQVSDRDYAIATSNGTNWLRAGTSTVLT